jgi:prepilin-type N-terminal cleavage/methylation domain-containing protein
MKKYKPQITQKTQKNIMSFKLIPRTWHLVTNYMPATRNSKHETLVFSTKHKTRNTKHLFSTQNTKLETRNPFPNAKHETQNTKHLRPTVTSCDNRGFTLIEIIVSILIFSILSALLFSTFIQIQRNINKNRWKSQLTQEGVRICNTIKMELIGAREIYYANQDSISFLNQEGKLSSFCCRDSALFKSNKSMISEGTKVTSFKFSYYLQREIINKSSESIHFLPVDPTDLERLKVVDWNIGLKKGITSIHLKTGVFTRNIRQQ